MENKRITTENLDFDGIKQGFKTFLQGQSKFSDYNFEGSGLSILLDVLAYNTHYNALYTNLAINEAFLDSASKRNSVVSKAKELGYVPRSYRCATTNINLLISFNAASSDTYLELPKYTRFGAKGENQTYHFYTTESHIAYKNGRSFSFPNIEVKEGTPLQYRYIAGENVEYKIPNTKVDISTLTVKVQETLSSSTYEIYSPASSVLNLDSNSPVFFVKESDNEYFQVEFGNGVIGKGVQPGNVISLEYMICNGSIANNLTSFTYGGRTYNSQQSTIVTVTTPSFGGGEVEDVESIRYNAPHYYTAQNRCVTSEDYKTLIVSLFPEASSVTVWGGEENLPPVYGNVYISVMPKNSERLTNTEKQYLLTEVIQPRQMMSTHPVFVDPLYIKLVLHINYYYDSQKTNLKATDLNSIVFTNIKNYNNTILKRFNGVFRHSNLTEIIDNSNISIQNSTVNIKFFYQFNILFNKIAQYSVNLYNPIMNFKTDNNAILSNGIVVAEDRTKTCYIDDVPIANSTTGQLRLFYYKDGAKTFMRYVGTVNYSTGQLTLNNLHIVDSISSTLDFTIQPASPDIVSLRNQIVMIDENKISLTPINTRITNSYKFTNIIE